MSVARGREYMPTLSCPDKPGIVLAVSGILLQQPANILARQQYGEIPDGRFFMQAHFSVPVRVRAPIVFARLGCPAYRPVDQESL